MTHVMGVPRTPLAHTHHRRQAAAQTVSGEKSHAIAQNGRYDSLARKAVAEVNDAVVIADDFHVLEVMRVVKREQFLKRARLKRVKVPLPQRRAHARQQIENDSREMADQQQRENKAGEGQNRLDHAVTGLESSPLTIGSSGGRPDSSRAGWEGAAVSDARSLICYKLPDRCNDTPAHEIKCEQGKKGTSGRFGSGESPRITKTNRPRMDADKR